jgi:hypothetical protein
MGRFMSPDPYKASAGPKDPGSWNRYAYTRGDPVNRGDPSGLSDADCPQFGLCYGETPLDFDWYYIYGLWWRTNYYYYDPGQDGNHNGGGGGEAAPPPPTDPNCDRADWLGAQRFVYSTIRGDIDALGLNVAGFAFDVQMAGGHNPAAPGQPADQTELVLSTANADAFNNFTKSICTTAGDPNCFSNAGWDPFHSGMNYRQNIADNSMQITGGFDSRSGQYVISIDIDPHNPNFGSLRGRLGHVGNVFGNGIAGGDTNYHNVAAGLNARGVGGGCP